MCVGIWHQQQEAVRVTSSTQGVLGVRQKSTEQIKDSYYTPYITRTFSFLMGLWDLNFKKAWDKNMISKTRTGLMEFSFLFSGKLVGLSTSVCACSLLYLVLLQNCQNLAT